MTSDVTEPLGTENAERRSRRAARHRRWRSRTLLIVALVVVALLGIGGWSLAAIQGRADNQEERAVEQEERAELSEANARIIAQQVTAACERQDEIAEQLGDVCQQAEQIADQPAQPVLPSDEQVDGAVQRYCRDVGCAEGPSAADVAAAVASYCDSRGECRGETGEQGEPGEAGDPGEDAEPPSDAQILAAVDAYCATRNQCQGPSGPGGAAGAPGADGQPGQDGVDGIDGQDGEPPFSWTFTHTPPIGPPTTYECTRTEPFDRAAPTYECQPVEG